MTNPRDEELAKKFGGFVSFETDTSPSKVEYYGESDTDEFDRLLNLYLQPESRVLDIGCGAGQTTCVLASRVAEIWGVDMFGELIEGASERARTLGLTNVHFIQGDKSDAHVLAALPEELDVIYSRRGPNLDEKLASRLRKGSVFLQLLVSEFDGYPLREIFGRRDYAPYHFENEYSHMVLYSTMGMQPVSIKTYFYDVFFRDIDHLEAFLINIPANLDDWRLSSLPYERERDRPALELYVRYHTTPDGIRALRHRRIFVFRKVERDYPAARVPLDRYPST